MQADIEIQSAAKLLIRHLRRSRATGARSTLYRLLSSTSWRTAGSTSGAMELEAVLIERPSMVPQRGRRRNTKPGSARASRADIGALANAILTKRKRSSECFGEAPKQAREGACAPQTRNAEYQRRLAMPIGRDASPRRPQSTVLDGLIGGKFG